MGKLNQRLSPRAGQHLIKQIADPVVPSSQRITDPIGTYHQQTLVRERSTSDVNYSTSQPTQLKKSAPLRSARLSKTLTPR